MMLRKIALGVLLLASPLWAAERPSIVHTQVNVTTASTEVLGTTPIIRRIMILQNDSDAVIYCNLKGATAALNAGIRLNASGGTIFMDVAVPVTKVNCIHGGTGNKLMLVTEG